MTYFPTRSILILLATSALGACASPNFPIDPPVIQPPPPAPRQAEPQPAPPVEEPAPTIPRPTEQIESRPLDQPAPAPPPAQEPPPAAEPPPAPTYRTVTTRSVTGKVVDAEGPAKIHEVKSGDNLEKIARKLDTTVEQLRKDNKLKSDVIQPGDELKGPRSKAKAYTVASGDTLFAVARRFGVTAAAIRSENDLKKNATLRPGQKLRLPAGYKDKGPIVTTSRVRIDPPPTPVERPVPPPVQVAQAAPPPAPTPKPAPPAPRPSTPPASTPVITGAPTASASPTDTQVSQMGRGRFVWPVRGDILSGFGPKGPSQRNDGVNIRAGGGEAVRSAAAGDVVYAGDQVPGFGNLVLIKHADGWVTAYGHLARVDVKMQQKVAQGQQIGQVGSTGGVAEPQLHFEVRYAPTPEERARPIDPALVLPR